MKNSDLVNALNANTATIGIISDRVQLLLDAIKGAGNGDVPVEVQDAAKGVTDALAALQTKAGA